MRSLRADRYIVFNGERSLRTVNVTVKLNVIACVAQGVNNAIVFVKSVNGETTFTDPRTIATINPYAYFVRGLTCARWRMQRAAATCNACLVRSDLGLA